jgi:YihY family inner membrane protein
MDLQGVKTRADEIQRGRRWLAFPYAVIKKFSADSSGNLAVLITYYAFFSIFPLLLALSSILGYVLKGHPDWAKTINDSAVANFPLIKGAVPRHGSVVIVAVGILLAVYSGLGVAKAAQNAFDVVYCVPKDDEPNVLWKNLRALRLVVVGGIGLIATTIVSSTVASAGAIGLHIGGSLSVLGIVVTVALNTLLFCVLFRWLTVREDIGYRNVFPGAALSAVVLAALQSATSAFIAHKLKGAQSTYGSFGTVIVLLSWFYLQSQVVLFAAQVNVVKQDHLWPRSLTE